MPLKIALEGNLYCPIIECDVCGQEITDGENGWYIYLYQTGPDKGHLPADDGRMYFAHKGRCLDRFEQQHAGRHRGFISLGDMMENLTYSLNLRGHMREHLNAKDNRRERREMEGK